MDTASEVAPYNLWQVKMSDVSEICPFTYKSCKLEQSKINLY